MTRIVTAEVRQRGVSASAGLVRGHEVLIDRPTAKGGADEGAMGGELLLMALGGCFLSNLLAAVRARNAEVSDVRLRVAATVGESPERFTSFELHVTATAPDRELLTKLATIAERGCLVSNTLAACAPIEVTVAPQ